MAYLYIKAFRPMIQSDLDDGDWSALISLPVPHAQLYFSCKTFTKEIDFKD